MAEVDVSVVAQPAVPANERPVFRLALTMSGAISAGAYTAGVFDFLMQALAEWDLLEKQDPHNPALPTTHKVRIVSMTGASAGGVTAALGTVALGYGMTFAPDHADATRQRLKLHAMTTRTGTPIACVLPRLYDAWVTRPSMVAGEAGNPDLLSTEDVKNTGVVASFLNWHVLNGIRDAALQRPDTPGHGAPYSFFADPFHVYLTISNLRGVPYDIKGDKDTAPYHMLSHGDRLHFEVDGLGGDPCVVSDWAGRDQAICMSLADLLGNTGPSEKWRLLGDAALATAAFPGGLSARLLRAETDDFKDRWFPAPKFDGTKIEPKWPAGFPMPPPKFGFVNVDGGVINNDPFDYARYTLLDRWEFAEAANPRNTADADRAVLMISPFPEGATFNTEDTLDTGLLSVAKALLPTLISQARFKLTELAAAADPNIASRWLIAPRRSDNTREPVSSLNIACGLLGGFGGFLDKSFREHDFQLGRRNCQKFLHDWMQSKFTMHPPAPVIPLFGSAVPKVRLRDWPRMSMAAFDELMQRIEERANVVIPALLEQEVGSWLVRWAAGTAWSGIALWGGAKGMLLTTVRGTILADLIQRDQIQDGLPDDDPKDPRLLRNFSYAERSVIAAMADPRYDLRTVKGIHATTKHTESFISDTIARAARLDGDAVHRVWKSRVRTSDGQETYTLYSRKLGARNWPRVGAVLRRMDKVTIDWPRQPGERVAPASASGP